jgi:hypothetical protein
MTPIAGDLVSFWRSIAHFDSDRDDMPEGRNTYYLVKILGHAIAINNR